MDPDIFQYYSALTHGLIFNAIIWPVMRVCMTKILIFCGSNMSVELKVAICIIVIFSFIVFFLHWLVFLFSAKFLTIWEDDVIILELAHPYKDVEVWSSNVSRGVIVHISVIC